MIGMAGPQKDYSSAVEMYEKGLSVGDVAEFFSVTRQSMWMTLRRRGVTMRPHLRYGQENHWYRGGSTEHKRAGHVVEKAVRRGLLVRSVKCSQCGDAPTFANGRTAIQAHHRDYNKPLDVTWLCQRCHHTWHRTNHAVARRERR